MQPSTSKLSPWPGKEVERSSSRIQQIATAAVSPTTQETTLAVGVNRPDGWHPSFFQAVRATIKRLVSSTVARYHQKIQSKNAAS
ncbi:hypothetical protein SAMN05216276_108622 [Streptosporangium subroseum]|uniref:Uncharacterized protein n=1 Tax=Streptosporangium subroseum TaxID=106412 RepID=A0A239P4P2_9ACTN|nr:hypothetical protein SAMN05216276_108622 [Streptosporangium subroseum]